MATEARARPPLARLPALPEGVGVESLVVGALGCLYCWLLAPATSDLAAAVFRSDLLDRSGALVYNAQWYDGHHLLAYSLLSPPLGALLGTRFVGAIFTFLAIAAFERIVVPRYGSAGRVAAFLFALTAVSSLLIGRIAFAVGLGFGVVAILLATRSRWIWACVAAVLAALGSPLAGLFVALLGASWFVAARRLWGLALAVVAIAPSLVLSYAFHEGGTFPYGWVSFLQLVGAVVLLLLAIPGEERLVRVALGLYLLLGLFAQVVPSQLGGNVNRLGTIVCAPLAACMLWRGRRLFFWIVLPYLIWWPLNSVARDLPDAGGAITERAYYRPLTDWLAANVHQPIRLEIPGTRNHWEGVYVGERYMLARGWERQLDQKYDSLFYGTIITPQNYRRWLARNAVSYVAVSSAATDFASRSETDMLIKTRLPYLRQVWSNRDWRLFAVGRPTPLLSGPGRLVSATPDSFTFDALRPGRFVMRLHFTPYWAITSGSGCVRSVRENYTGLTVRRPGRVTVSLRLSPGRVVTQGPRCT